MTEITTELWEIMVPTANNAGLDFSLQHHQVWDEFVRTITGGLTIMRTAKGQWYNDQGQLFSERVIPVRIACTEDQIRSIMAFSLRHYGQLAIMASQLSLKSIILKAD